MYQFGELYGPFDRFEREELDASQSMKLDTIGMQPHSREFLERKMTGIVGQRKYECLENETIDYTPGIQFTEYP